MKRATVMLADDHAIVAEAMVSYLQQWFEMVGTVHSAVNLPEEVRKRRPDVLLMDMGMPGMSGLEALRRLRAEGLATKVIFLTMHAEPDLAAEAMRAGAMGYVLKNAAGEELFSAIRQVLRGAVYISAQIAQRVMSSLAGAEPPSSETLSQRQRDVLQLIAVGKTMKEIAAALKISPRTVETHKYAMMQRLHVQTTVELVQYAARHGLILN
jgi:DNA-binding NarL/FixJ family response regulator